MSFLKQRGVVTTEQKCKVKTTINVDSEKYNSHETYSKSIDDDILISLFKSIGDSYNTI